AAMFLSVLFFHAPPPPALYTLSLHDALPISAFAVVAELRARGVPGLRVCASSDEAPEVTEAADLVVAGPAGLAEFLDGLMAKLRSEEHTSELQSRFDLVCRLLLEQKKNHHNV